MLGKLKPTSKIILSVAMILLGSCLLILAQIKDYTLLVDDNEIRIKAIALRARQLFDLANIELEADDRISTDPNAVSFSLPSYVTMHSARNVLIKTSEEDHVYRSAELIPANLLALADLRFFPSDLILMNGQPIPIDQPLQAGQDVILEYLPAKRIDIYADQEYLTTLFTQAFTFLEALEQNNLPIHPLDDFNPNLDTKLEAENRLDLIRSKQVCVKTNTQIICGLTTASTISQALIDLNATPQFLDFTETAGPSLVKSEEHVQFHHVSERVILQKDESTFGFSYQADPTAELDSTTVLVPGRPGIIVSRTTKRIVDGEVYDTVQEEAWQASQESDAIYGYGTLATLKTEVVDGQTIEYWRKVSVYATSYHPAEFGGSTQTRSGLPLTKGIIAVSAAWYPSMALQNVYVTGYGFGTIADSGGGIPGRYWIDLGYDDENHIGWHSQTTLYFLAPIPSNYLGILP